MYFKNRVCATRYSAQYVIEKHNFTSEFPLKTTPNLLKSIRNIGVGVCKIGII